MSGPLDNLIDMIQGLELQADNNTVTALRSRLLTNFQKLGLGVNISPPSFSRQTVLSATLPTEQNNIFEPNVIYESGSILFPGSSVFKIWYAGGWDVENNIFYAESLDGINWTKLPTNPILADYTRASLSKINGIYYLIVAPQVPLMERLDLYTSTDGINFTLLAADILHIGSMGQWDSEFLANCALWLEPPNGWKLLYEARAPGELWKIGLATSSNGITWTKSPSNPVIRQSGCGGPALYSFVNGIYTIFIHATPGNFNLPTDIYKFQSTNLIDWNPVNPGGIFFARQTADEGPTNNVGQVADPYPITFNGNLYLFYSASVDGSLESGGLHIKLAIQD